MLGRWDDHLIKEVSDVPSIIFFIISYRLRALKTIRKKIEMIFENNFARNYEKKKYLEYQTLGR